MFKILLITLLTVGACSANRLLCRHNGWEDRRFLQKDQRECAPRVLSLLNTPRYRDLNKVLTPTVVRNFEILTFNIINAPNPAIAVVNYQLLVVYSQSIETQIVGGRIVVTTEDGTVVYDGGEPEDPDNLLPQGNSYQHFITKTVNENHNSRIAFLDAQLWPCGVGVETKFSSTVSSNRSRVTRRLGEYLNSVGTVGLSKPAPL